MKRTRERGITLIALVVTIIVLVILAGVGLNLVLGQYGIIEKTKTAKEETTKEAATEIINLKITTAQMNSYIENNRMPTLQELSDSFCEDEDFEYVSLTTKVASLDKIDVEEGDSIYTKLKDHPYEFEINSSLQLASINGVKVADNTDSIITENNKLYQKLRSDDYEEVSVVDGGRFTAPCDGYYCLSAYTDHQTVNYISFALHYTANDVLISRIPGTGYDHSNLGCEIYMKKGEYITFTKQQNAIIDSSKFFYAVGCQPETQVQ